LPRPALYQIGKSIFSVNIEDWLLSHKLEEYIPAFVENRIDITLLTELGDADLRELGVQRLGDRKRMQKAILELSAQDEAQSVADKSPMPAGERRQVTVLFADLSGFTRLSSELGAEATHELLNQYFDVVDAIVANHGGRVDKHIGDSVMAVFGAPIAHDDDPMRAIHTAMAIHQSMPDLVQGRQHRAHIGIASGQVVASGTGSDTHREYTVTGDSVNLASRLQDLAKAGETLISNALYHVVTAGVECVSLGDTMIKGIDQPLAVWRVEGLRNTFATPYDTMVGRDTELAQFASTLDACLSHGHGQAVVLRGEAGIGKTRLVAECTALAASHGCVCHHGLVLDFGVGKGQEAIPAIVRSLLGIEAGAGKQLRSAKAKEAIIAGRLDRAQGIYLNDLLNLPQSDDEQVRYDVLDNASRNQGKCEVITGLLRSGKDDQAILVVVEDIHWASQLNLDYIAHIASVITDVNGLLLLTSRIEGYPLTDSWRADTGRCSLLTIDLGPLREADALKLASRYMDSHGGLAEDCVKRADGNPLFLEQLLHNQAEHGDGDVPPSIQSLVLARIDRLAGEDKGALQAASVLGQRFSVQALCFLTEVRNFSCDELIRRQLVKPADDQFLFAHALVQEGVYSSLIGAKRRALHCRAAAYFGDAEPILKAQHLDRGDDASADAAYLLAARFQADLLRFDSATNLAARGVELCHDDSTLCELLCVRGGALRELGDTKESVSIYSQALKIAPSPELRYQASIGLAKSHRISDQRDEALAAVDIAQQVSEQLDTPEQLALSHYLRGNVLFPSGDYARCLAEHERALALYRKAESSEGEARALGGLGDAYYLKGWMRSSYEQFTACIELCRQHGYRRIEADNHPMLGWTVSYLLQFEKALEYAERAIQLAGELNQRRVELQGRMMTGSANLRLGRLDQAEQQLRMALEISERIGATNFRANTGSMVARIAYRRGDVVARQRAASDAIQWLEQANPLFCGVAVFSVAACCVTDSKETRRLLDDAERLLDSGCVSHNQFDFGEYGIDAALDLGDYDRVERYAKRLEQYTQGEPLPLSDLLIARARVLVAWGRDQVDDALVAQTIQLRDSAVKVGFDSVSTALSRVLET
jgi:class 3 adenylate cyclase/tetratricopeptide (TPR) repeat protein